MGKYFGSPWGFIRGKLGDTVGGYWKGVEWCRVRVYPTQRGTLDLYRQLKEGLIPPERFSFKQMNIRRLVTQVLGWIGKNNLSSLIYPVWEKLCKKRKLKMTGTNFYVKRNAARLFASIPNADEEYDADTNFPDMLEMLIADGDLAPTPLWNSTYDPVTGVLKVEWQTDLVKNQKETDIAYVMAYIRPVVDDEWYPNGHLYGKAELPTPPEPVRDRNDASMEITIDTGLDATKMSAYLFFKDSAGEIGFSPSTSRIVSAI